MMPDTAALTRSAAGLSSVRLQEAHRDNGQTGDHKHAATDAHAVLGKRIRIRFDFGLEKLETAVAV